MTAKYQIVSDDEFSGAIIKVPGDEPRTVSSDHPNWEQIKTHLLTDVDDDAALIALVEPIKSVTDTLLRLTERVTYKSGALFFDGDALDSALADHIVKIIQAGANESDYKSFALFLENLAQNPSKKSRKHLYSFVETHGMTVSEDGMLIAYKGVKADGGSISQGFGIVNGVEYNGSLPNEIGAVVEVPRSMVDSDRDVACSTGLHAGTYDYAKGFSQGRLLTVKVNPRDVVSVPSDHSNAKIRTARYNVLEVTEQEITSLTYDTSSDDDWEPDEEEDGEGYEETEEEDDSPVSEDAPVVAVGAEEDTSDDALADVIAQAVKGAGTAANVTINLTVNGRDEKGRFLPGDANPGKSQPRSEKGHFLPTHE